MEFYSPFMGNCTLEGVDGMGYPIVISNGTHRLALPANGRHNNGELMLFPSKDLRTWEGWKKPIKRWKPKHDDEYYYITNQVGASATTCISNIDRRKIIAGNCFRTFEQAEEAAKRVREVLEKYHEEIGE